MKLYIEDIKYGKIKDNFNIKLRIFQNLCVKIKIEKKQYIIIFLIMLKGKI